MQMNYCMHCGTKLILKYLESEEKDIPFCPSCNDFRFPVFNTAVSTIIHNADDSRYLLIKQYGGNEYILCAGYVNKGEDAEDAVKREIKEELGLDAESITFNRSHYFAPSNTLMLNFTATVTEEKAHPNEEIDSWKWFAKEDVQNYIRKNSLAEAFLKGYFTKQYIFPVYPAKPYKQ